MLEDVQEISRQIRFAIARKWHARDRDDKKAEAEPDAEIARLRPLVERDPTAEELTAFNAHVEELSKQSGPGTHPHYSNRKASVHPSSQTNPRVRVTTGEPIRHVRRRR
jgi:hypothetical protein